MSDTLHKHWIYPPNFEEIYGEGWPAEAKNVHGPDGHQKTGFREYSILFGGLSDGTGLSKHLLVDLSNLRCPDGRVARRTLITRIKFNTYGCGLVLYWDRTPSDVIICHLPQGRNGELLGPIIDHGKGDGTDGTGDILVSTEGSVDANDSYQFEMTFKVKAQNLIVPPSSETGYEEN